MDPDGGRSRGPDAKLGGEAVLAVGLADESIRMHRSGGTLMVTASGTGVRGA